MPIHKKFKTSGNTIVINDFKKSLIAFRDNTPLVRGATEKGYTDIPFIGIMLNENIRSDNELGGEWITIFYEKSNS